jgi:septal ring factor EnvC (AmiA/AmiB activator)
MNDTTRTIVAKAIESRREELKGIKEQRTSLESSMDAVREDLGRMIHTLVTVNSTIVTIVGEIEALQEDLRRYDAEGRPGHVLTGYNVSSPKSIQETM